MQAIVAANESCPEIQPGPGRVVLTTIENQSDTVYELNVASEDGNTESIRSTGSHRFFRESDGSWVSAETLLPGDELQGADGTLNVAGIAKVPGLHTVFNMTVEGEHVYRVSALGALVHNNCGDNLVTQISGVKGTTYFSAPTRVANATPEAYAGVRQASQYLREAGVPRHIRKQVLESFDRQAMRVRVAGEAEFGIRYFDNVNAWPKGRYLFEQFPATRNSLALPPNWNQMTHFKQFQIRQGTTILEGPAARQGFYPGGQVQKYIANLDDLLDP